METQEYPASWDNYFARLKGENIPFRPDVVECGLYPARSPDNTKWQVISFTNKPGEMIGVTLPNEQFTDLNGVWARVLKKVLSADETKHVMTTGHLPPGFDGAAIYLSRTGRLPYAVHEARLRGEKIDMRPGEPDLGHYIIGSRDRTHWRPVMFGHDDEGNVTCSIGERTNEGPKFDGFAWEQLPRFPEDQNGRGWERLWGTGSCKPVSKKDYDHLVATGRLPGESEAAAADRTNGATVPTARSDESTVTATHNQPPEADTIEALKGRHDKLKMEADPLIKKGPAKTKDEADRATDLKDAFLKIEKRAEELYKIEYDPLDQQVKTLRAKWNLLRTEPEIFKKLLLASVVSPWMKAETKRQQDERAAQVTAGVNPDELPAVSPPRTGTGLGRQTAPRTTWEAEIVDYDAFLAHVKNQEAVKEVVLKIANVYARSKIEPVPPGIKYKKETGAA